MNKFVVFGGINLSESENLILTKDIYLDNTPHTYIGIQRTSNNSTSHYVEWDVRGWYFNKRIITLIGEDGEYIKIKDGDILAQGNMSCGKNIFTGAKNLSVGNLSWGMRKTICIETAERNWVDFTQGIDSSIVGINSIDSNTSKVCYLVGWSGAIYKLIDKYWHEVDSPTNTRLNSLAVLETNIAYACGQNGVVLRLDNDHIDTVEHQYKSEDFLGIEQSNGRVFIFSYNTVFEVIRETLIPRYGWDPSEDGIYISTIPMKNGFWLLSESKIHVFKDNKWQ